MKTDKKKGVVARTGKPKAKIILVSLVLFLGLHSNAQTDFGTIGARWYYNCCAGGNIANSHLEQVISEENITIGGKDCRILRQYRNNSNTANAEYILRQEQGKVYYYHQNHFRLLFDFGVEVNDVVEFSFHYKKYGNDYPLYKDTVLTARYQVEKITTNTQDLKTFVTKILEEDKFTDSGLDILPYRYSYTEKIGYYYEFMPVLDNLVSPATDNFPMLRCYSDADLSFVSDEWTATSLACDYVTATTIIIPKAQESAEVRPNPFDKHLLVTTNCESDIKIVNVAGKIIYHSKLLNGINKIPTTHFVKGIYLVQIQNNSIKTFKIIKI